MDTRRRTSPWQAGLWAAALALGAAAPAVAAEPGNVNDVPRTPGMQDKQSDKLNVSDQDIKSLRERGYTWGDIGRALVIADQSGKKLTDVTSLRDSGLGWDDIGSRFNVSGFGGQEQGSKKSRKHRASPPTPSGASEPGMREAPSGMQSPRGSSMPSSPGVSPTMEPGSTPPGAPSLPGTSEPVSPSYPSTPGSTPPPTP